MGVVCGHVINGCGLFQIVTALSLAGDLRFNPLTDSLTGKDGGCGQLIDTPIFDTFLFL